MKNAKPNKEPEFWRILKTPPQSRQEIWDERVSELIRQEIDKEVLESIIAWAKANKDEN